MEPGTELKVGDVVQLSPECRNPMFAHCMMTVTEPRDFGAMGYIQVVGTNEKPGGQAYYRARWNEMERVGMAWWVAE